MKTITGTTKAWLSNYDGPDALEGEQDKAVSALWYSAHDMTGQGWVYAGVANITIEVVSNDDLIANKVATLRKELQTVRAKAEVAAGDIEAKIQKLLAITCEVSA